MLEFSFEERLVVVCSSILIVFGLGLSVLHESVTADRLIMQVVTSRAAITYRKTDQLNRD